MANTEQNLEAQERRGDMLAIVKASSVPVTTEYVAALLSEGKRAGGKARKHREWPYNHDLAILDLNKMRREGLIRKLVFRDIETGSGAVMPRRVLWVEKRNKLKESFK